ncbi:GntR family transcriptional regulator [Opitutaceae bacterium TAV4]|nr:GntR family transcriptional regulator [Opitutaceae bacterium TAV4]RRK02226.1 GntR family transcriptional regulator [Opitutaceae bacterium TAV3]
MISRIPSKISAIHTELRQRVLGGIWKLDEKLPTETELAAEFDCSLGTVAKAMALLAHEGLVERRPRAGTRVISNAAVPASPSGPATDLDAFAFIYPSDQHDGIWRTVKGFQAAANKASRRVVTLSTGTDYAKEAEYLSRLSEFAVRGAVFYPLIQSPQEQVQLSNILVNSRFPIVLADLALPGLGCPSVMVDGFHAGYTATRHLLAQGLTRIGFLANHAWAPSVGERHQGYLWALEEAGLAPDPRRILLDPTMRPDFDDPLKDPTELGIRYFEQASPPPPVPAKNKAPGIDVLQAVVCVNDHIAAGLILAAEKLGLTIPKHLKIVGIDDSGLALPNRQRLTTYHVPFEDLGRSAFELLSNRIQNPDTVNPVTRIRGEIIARDTA